MRFQKWLLLAPLFLGGCSISAWGNLFVLAVTLGIFCATLNLGRRPLNDGSVRPADSETLRD